MAKPINIFIIYAREDKAEKKILLDFLSPMIEPYNLTIWHDEHIQPGQEWKPHIESRLSITDIFILLVSVSFLNSKFIKQIEFKYALDRHKANKSVVIPVIIKYCLWDDPLPYDNYSFSLTQLQVLPTDGKPIIEWRSADEAYSNIAKGIRSVIIERRANQKRQESQEEEFWNNAVQKKSISSYNEYVQNYPEGKFYEEAKNAVMIFEEREKERIERNKQEIENAKTEFEKQKIEEEILWESTRDINTIDAYNNYLVKSTLGSYSEQANKSITEIEKKNREIVAEQERLLMVERDNTLWQKTVKENTSDAFKQYLQLYPAGNYRQDAKIAIDDIEEIEKKDREIVAEQERELKEEQENKLWEEITAENTIAAYEKYLQSTTVGLFKEKAFDSISQLDAEEKEKEDQQGWQIAKAENTINSYNSYLQYYPNGIHNINAATAIKDIEDAASIPVNNEPDIPKPSSNSHIFPSKDGDTNKMLHMEHTIVELVKNKPKDERKDYEQNFNLLNRLKKLWYRVTIYKSSSVVLSIVMIIGNLMTWDSNGYSVIHLFDFHNPLSFIKLLILICGLLIIRFGGFGRSQMILIKRLIFCLPFILLFIITFLYWYFGGIEFPDFSFWLTLTCSACLFILAWLRNDKKSATSSSFNISPSNIAKLKKVNRIEELLKDKAKDEVKGTVQNSNLLTQIKRFWLPGTIYKTTSILTSTIMIIGFFMPWVNWTDPFSAWDIIVGNKSDLMYKHEVLAYFGLLIPISGYVIIAKNQNSVGIKRLVYCLPLVSFFLLFILIHQGRFPDGLLLGKSFLYDFVKGGFWVTFICSACLCILAWFGDRGRKKTATAIKYIDGAALLPDKNETNIPKPIPNSSIPISSVVNTIEALKKRDEAEESIENRPNAEGKNAFHNLSLYKLCSIGLSILIIIGFFMPWFNWLGDYASSAWKLIFKPEYLFSQSPLRYMALFIPICSVLLIFYQLRKVQEKLVLKRLLFCAPLVFVVGFASLIRYGSSHEGGYHILIGLLLTFICSLCLFILAWFRERDSKKTK